MFFVGIIFVFAGFAGPQENGKAKEPPGFFERDGYALLCIAVGITWWFIHRWYEKRALEKFQKEYERRNGSAPPPP